MQALTCSWACWGCHHFVAVVLLITFLCLLPLHSLLCSTKHMLSAFHFNASFSPGKIAHVITNACLSFQSELSSCMWSVCGDAPYLLLWKGSEDPYGLWIGSEDTYSFRGTLHSREELLSEFMELTQHPSAVPLSELSLAMASTRKYYHVLTTGEQNIPHYAVWHYLVCVPSAWPYPTLSAKLDNKK